VAGCAPSNSASSVTNSPPQNEISPPNCPHPCRQRTSHHLARVTAYWSAEDRDTRRGLSASGLRLCSGHCAVDPRIIPYGSAVKINGVGTYLAADTGTAVKNRKAAREAGRTTEERAALVIDIYFSTTTETAHFLSTAPAFAQVTWTPPSI
jgi:hypothetical protein